MYILMIQVLSTISHSKLFKFLWKESQSCLYDIYSSDIPLSSLEYFLRSLEHPIYVIYPERWRTRTTSVRRACLLFSDWPSWLPSIFFICVYVSRYVNMAYTKALYHRLDAYEKRPWIRGAGDNVFIVLTKCICPTRLVYI